MTIKRTTQPIYHLFRQVEAAEFLGVSARTISRWVVEGRIKKMALPGCYISRTEIERFLKDNGDEACVE